MWAQARAYDVGPDAMAFDVDVRWQSAMVAEIDVFPQGQTAAPASSLAGDPWLLTGQLGCSGSPSELRRNGHSGRYPPAECLHARRQGHHSPTASDPRHRYDEADEYTSGYLPLLNARGVYVPTGWHAPSPADLPELP